MIMPASYRGHLCARTLMEPVCGPPCELLNAPLENRLSTLRPTSGRRDKRSGVRGASTDTYLISG
jgi:hypothetical protein